MSTVRDFFAAEAGECLSGLDRVVGTPDGATDPTELLRLSRMLRGSAQLAREEQTAVAARALEAVARAVVSRVVTWNPAIQEGVRSTVADLRALVSGSEPGTRADDRVAAVLARWSEADLRIPGLPTPVAPSKPAAPAAANRDPQLRAFVAREGAGITDDLDAALALLSREPWDREPLKRILRRQRVLLGAAWLDAFPAVAETLRAVDGVCRLIARHNVPVTDDWFALFDAARAVLAETLADLARGELTGTAPSLPRLRATRDDLAARSGEVVAPGGAGLDTSDGPRGEAALRRALELRPVIERAVGDSPAGHAAVAELFELIQRGLS